MSDSFTSFNGQGAPFKTVLTHGWVVDGEGKAMHKSLGNSIAPEEMIKKYGADLVRLWVASSDYRVDVRVSDNIFKQLSETYRKIRNTSRIILANLNDFNPDTDMVALDELYEIDKWALSRLNNLAIMAYYTLRTIKLITIASTDHRGYITRLNSRHTVRLHELICSI